MRRRRKLWIALAALVLLLAGGDTLYWRFVTQQLDAGFRDWVAAERAGGGSVQADPPQPGGWPFAATLTTAHVELTDTLEFPGGLAWRADRLTLRIDLLHPRHLQAIPGGMQRLRLGNAPFVPFTAGRMTADIPLPQDQPPHEAVLQAENLRAGVSAGGDTGGSLTVRRLSARFDVPPGQPKPVLAYTLSADTVTLPSRFRWALGDTIAAVSADGILSAPFPPGNTALAQAIAWHQQGGELDLRHFALHWGPLGLSANGKLVLDQQLQPAGQLTARVTGYDGTLDAMTQAGVLPGSAALAARAVLSLLAKPAANGQPSEVEVPLRLQHNMLFMQNMPLARVPVLDWQQP